MKKKFDRHSISTRLWACFMSEAGERMYKGIEKGLDALKEALDD